jgi:hypothetical protein
VKFLVLYATLIPMAPYARLDISLQVGSMRLLVNLDHWKSMATDAQTLVVTCEDGWVFLYTAIISFSGDHSGHRHEALWRTLKLPAGRIRKWEDNVKSND